MAQRQPMTTKRPTVTLNSTYRPGKSTQRQGTRKGPSLLLAALTVLALATTAIPSATMALEADARRTITVSGTGKISAVPDRVSLSLGVQSQAKQAQDALAQNTKSMQKLFATLEKADIDKRFIQTSQFSVNPVYNRPKDGSPSIVTGYRVTNTVTVTLDEIEKLGGLLDAVVTAGSNRINGISFSISNAEELLNKAREKAVTDAVEKAKLYVGAAGVALGQILTISEGGSFAPEPKYMRSMMTEADMAVPIAAGEQELSARVTVVIELD